MLDARLRSGGIPRSEIRIQKSDVRTVGIGFSKTKSKMSPFLPLTREVGRRLCRRVGGRDKSCQNSEFRGQKSERVVAGFPVQISEFRGQMSEVRKAQIRSYHLPPLTRGLARRRLRRRDWGRDKVELSACYAPFFERREGSLPPSRAARVPPPSSEGGKGDI